jgi:type III restriction enzyme
MRLAVDQDLQRIAEPNVNILTVVANESYERYVESLQTEYAADDDTTGDGAPPKPADARKRVRVRLSKARLADPEFERLWSMVARRTRYSLRINSGALERDVVPKLAAVRVARPRIAARKTRIAVNSEEAFEALQMSASRSVADLAGRYPLPNLLDLILHLMQETSPPIRLTRKTVLACLKGAADNDAMALNPEDFARQAVKIFRESLMDQLVGGIKYEPTGDVYEVSQFAEEFEAWANNVVPCTKSPYDGVVYDSDGERNFAECLERLKPVTCYVKLPSWFLVPTPLGNYNPDWAIVWRDVDEHGEPTGKPTLYLVRETKFPTEDLSVLRPGERRKILCAQDHFGGALKVDYAVRASPDRLP